jgi:hypothetical protein
MTLKSFAILSLLVLASCKPKASDGKLASVDNFAGTGAKKFNICSGPARTSTVLPSIEISANSAKDQKTADLIKDATLHALSAVPDQIMTLFASQDKSVIRISSDVEAICSKQLSGADLFYASEGGRISSCWDTSDNRIVIYLKADPLAIQHNLVRMLARATSEVIAAAGEQPMTRSKPGYQEFVRRTDSFQKFKFDLASTFIKEVEAARSNGAKVSLDPYANLLADGNIAGRKLFDHFVYAESFDSYYCNSNSGGTRDTFKKDFPKTHDIFANYARRIESDGEFLADVRRSIPPRPASASISNVDENSEFNLGFFDWITPSWWSSASKNVDGAFETGRSRAKMYQDLSMPNSRVSVKDVNRMSQDGLRKATIIGNSGSNSSNAGSSKPATQSRSWFPWR